MILLILLSYCLTISHLNRRLIYIDLNFLLKNFKN
jgi:hypothetical protein